MNYYTYLFLGFTLIAYGTAETFDNLYNYVVDQIQEADSYILPKNNELLYTSNNSKVKDIGLYDFVIIGGGSAGSILASRLSEVRHWKILLLEAGGNQTEFSDIPGFSSYLVNSPMNWGYNTTSQTTCCQGMVEKKCTYPRGKVLGGGATINYLGHFIGVPEDYNNWANILDDPTWSYESVLPFFKKLETADFRNADPLYHGFNGPIHVNYTSPKSAIAPLIKNAFKENGVQEIDYNGEGIVGISEIQLNVKGNKRDNSAHGYLDPHGSRTNLKIYLNAFVTKILTWNKIAYGVEFVRNKTKYRVMVKKEVILSAGAINSPQILLLSGIGPSDELKSKKIPVTNNLPAVGKHLKDHTMFSNFYIRTNATLTNNGGLKDNLKRWTESLTPLTNGAVCELVAFIDTNNSKIRDVEFAICQVASNATYNPETDILISVIVVKPKSEGSVSLQSNSPKDFPLIDVNYFSDKDDKDIETMYEGIKYLINLTKTTTLQAVNATIIGEQPGCEDLKNDDRKYWYCAIRSLASTVFHPIGTTRMGKSILNSVVDSNFKVHNMNKLRVVDAGVMPDMVSGHPNTPIYMIAEVAADKIKREYLKFYNYCNIF